MATSRLGFGSHNGDKDDKVEVNTDNLVLGVLGTLVTAVLGAIGTMWRKITGMETRQALVERATILHEKQRQEDRADRDAARQLVIERIDLHHKVVVDKVDGLSNRVDRLERTVKNGHG